MRGIFGKLVRWVGEDDPPSTSTPTSVAKTFTVPEAAVAIGVGVTTAKKLIATGELKSFVVRRRRLVRREAIDAFLERREAGKGRRK